MKRIAAIAVLFFSANAHAADGPIPSEQQQKCNELIGIVAAGATWRDNFVPFGVAQGNLYRALQDTNTPQNLWGQWLAELGRVYGSKVSGEVVEENLKVRCH